MTRESYTPLRKGLDRTLFVILVAALVGLGTLYIKTKEQKADSLEYHTRIAELHTFFAPAVSIEGNSYTLTDTGVRDAAGARAGTSTALTYLRTADYVTRTRLDPIMALPETDLEHLKTAVAELGRYTEELAPHFPEAELALIEKTLHPVSFLETIPALESARRALLADPSPQTVHSYDKTLKHALNKYVTFTDTLLQSLPEIEALAEKRASEVARGKKDDVYYIFPGGETSIPHLRTVTARLHTQAKYLEKKREDRITCFRGSMAECPSLDRALQNATTLHMSGGAAHETSRALPENASEVQNILAEVMRERPQFRELLGNVEAIALSESRCLAASAPTYYTTWLGAQWRPHKKATGLTLRHMPVHDLYFYSAAQGVEQGSADYFANALANDLPYLHQSLGNLYMCPDHGAVAARLATLATIHTRLAADPIFSTLATTSELQQEITSLKRQERVIVQHSLVSEAETAAYLEQAANLLQKTGETALAETIGEQKVRSLEELLLLARAETAHFAKTIATMSDINKGLPGLIENGANILIDYLYISRSGYLQLLLAFNDTVVDTDISFFANRDTPDLEAYGLHGYHNTLKNEYTKEEIVDLILRADAFYLH